MTVGAMVWHYGRISNRANRDLRSVSAGNWVGATASSFGMMSGWRGMFENQIF